MEHFCGSQLRSPRNNPLVLNAAGSPGFGDILTGVVGDAEEVVHAYEHFLFCYRSSDLLVMDTSEIDFVGRSEHLQELLQRLSQPVKDTQYFLPLGSAPAD
jgi:hypothetical protein